MQIGISTATFFKKLYNEDAVRLMDEWGIPTCEVFFTSYCEYGKEFSETVKHNKGKVEVYSVHDLTNHFEPQLYSDHPRVRSDAYAMLQKVMEGAETLGAKYYSFHGIARLKRTFRENFSAVIAETQKITEFCAKYGVTLSYENVEWAFVNRPEAFARLKEGCPDLHGLLDIKQARLSGYDWREYLNAMAGCISHVHVSDVTGEGKMCLPGRGVFPFDELFSRLADTGFSGNVFIENYPSDYGELREVKESYEFLRERVQKYEN